MERFGSFTVDHEKLHTGVYVSRVDSVGSGSVYTIDIRTCRPYVDPVMSNMVMHSVEHIVATRFEEESKKQEYVKKVYFGPMGCFERGTKVIMYDGSLKNVEDVRVGDLLMGDDSTPREVLNLIRGNDMMYRVDQSQGDSYVVNGKHILTLKKSKNDTRQGYCKGDIREITVEDFMALSDHQKNDYKGYKCGYECDEALLEIPPYILGLWLGDGVRCKPCLCISDDEPEISESWASYAESIGCYVNVERDKGRSTRNWIHHERNSHKENPFMSAIRKLGLYKNKHIPECYYHSSRAQRLELLAGLINSDGWCCSVKNSRVDKKCCVGYGSADLNLLYDVKRLGDSLGFYTNVIYAREERSSELGGMNYYHLNIGGDLSDLATLLLDHKKPAVPIGKDYSLSKLNITPIGLGDYYGFETDGNKRFLLGSGTVVHNCMTGFYALFYVDDKAENAKQTMLNILDRITDPEFDEIPFNNCIDCGNCVTLASFPDDIADVKAYMRAMNYMANSCAVKGRFDEYPS